MEPLYLRTKSIECSIYSEKELKENKERLTDFNSLPNLVLKTCHSTETTKSTVYHIAIHRTDVSKGSLVDLSAALRSHNLVITAPFAAIEEALLDLAVEKVIPGRIVSKITKDTINVRLNASFELFAFNEEKALEYTEKEHEHVSGLGNFKFCGKPYAFVIRYKPYIPGGIGEKKDLMKTIKEFSLSKIFDTEELTSWIKDAIHKEFPFIEENYLLHAVTVF